MPLGVEDEYCSEKSVKLGASSNTSQRWLLQACENDPSFFFRINDNMAEALAIVGLAAALLQFVDFGTKVIRRLRQLEDQATESTACLKSVRNRLPLMLDLVKKMMLQMEAGLVSDESKEVMYPVVKNCISQAEELDKLFNKSVAQPKDNSWIRGKKAICSVWNDAEIERIDAGLKNNFELLVQAGTFQAIKGSGGTNSISNAPTFAPTVSYAGTARKATDNTTMGEDRETSLYNAGSIHGSFSARRQLSWQTRDN